MTSARLLALIIVSARRAAQSVHFALLAAMMSRSYYFDACPAPGCTRQAWARAHKCCGPTEKEARRALDSHLQFSSLHADLSAKEASRLASSAQMQVYEEKIDQEQQQQKEQQQERQRSRSPRPLSPVGNLETRPKARPPLPAKAMPRRPAAVLTTTSSSIPDASSSTTAQEADRDARLRMRAAASKCLAGVRKAIRILAQAKLGFEEQEGIIVEAMAEMEDP